MGSTVEDPVEIGPGDYVGYPGDVKHVFRALEAATKARYLIQLFAGTADGQDPRRQALIASALDDLGRLSE